MDKIKVLIIDDEPLLVKSTQLALSLYGFDTRSAADGPAGLAAAEKETPDVILLDIMMPGMDGWEVLQKLKESPGLSGIPVVVFTAKEYYNGKAMARGKGAADFVAKPFEPDALRDILLDVARRR